MGNILLLFLHLRECIGLVSFNGVRCSLGVNTIWDNGGQILFFTCSSHSIQLINLSWVWPKCAQVWGQLSCEFDERVPTAKKLITRPIMAVTSPNSPHITFTYTKFRFDHFFYQTYHGQKVSYVLKVGLFSCPVQKVTKSPGFPQPNFTKWLWFLAIFQRPWVYHGLWKIPKPQYFCTVWSVEILD